MNWKTLVSLTVAIVMGLAAMWVGKDLVMGNRTQQAGVKMLSMVVARHDMDPGTELAEVDLTTLAVPADSVSAAVMTDLKALVGRVLVSPVTKGTPMQESLLAKPGAEAGIVGMIPEGKRAVSIEVNESSGVSGLIVPGARVDVIATIRQPEGEVARTIVENVTVKAVNRRTGRLNDDPKSEPQQVKTVTLIVEPRDVEAIELAGNNGRLRLALRGIADNKPTQSSGVNFDQLTGREPQRAAPLPTTQPAGPSAMDKLIAAISAAAANSKPHEPRMERRIVPVSRGGRETVIVYERPAGVFKDPDEGWTVASQPQQDYQPGGAGNPQRPGNSGGSAGDNSRDPFH
jgi:pilus assembly protein CpaB